MNGHCSSCDVESNCAYKYKPCDCRDYMKFVAKPEPEELKLVRTVKPVHGSVSILSAAGTGIHPRPSLYIVR